MEDKMELKNIVTFGHLLAIMSILVIPLLVWGNKIEKHMTSSNLRNDILEKELEELKQHSVDYQKKTNNDYLTILDKLHAIDLKISKIK